MNKLGTIVAGIAGVAGLAMLGNLLLNQFDSGSVGQFGFVTQSICDTVIDLDINQCEALYNLYQANPNSLVLKNKFAQLPLTTLCDQNIFLCFSKKVGELRLGNNQITDISALAGLESLTSLGLYNNQITDISALEGLKSLTYLNLNNNQITDISALEGLESLTYLYLDNNQITDISALEGLKSLRWLSLLDNNQITDISALAGLKSLTYLNLGNNQITDISALEGLKSLRWLSLLGNNQITDISALAGLKSLTYLNLGNNQITDISALEGLKSLTSLGLYTNQITDISALAGLKSLTSLYLDNNQITDISALEGLKSLTYLNLGNNQITDISALAGLKSLTSLGLGYNQITDISALEGLESLTNLYLDNNQICGPISPIITIIQNHLLGFTIGNNYINRGNEDDLIKNFVQKKDSTWNSQATCSNAICGTKNRKSFYGQHEFTNSNDTLCSVGKPNPAAPTLSNHTWSWSCSNGGNTVSCSATELYCGDNKTNGTEKCDGTDIGSCTTNQQCNTSCQCEDRIKATECTISCNGSQITFARGIQKITYDPKIHNVNNQEFNNPIVGDCGLYDEKTKKVVYGIRNYVDLRKLSWVYTPGEGTYYFSCLFPNKKRCITNTVTLTRGSNNKIQCKVNTFGDEGGTTSLKGGNQGNTTITTQVDRKQVTMPFEIDENSIVEIDENSIVEIDENSIVENQPSSSIYNYIPKTTSKKATSTTNITTSIIIPSSTSTSIYYQTNQQKGR